MLKDLTRAIRDGKPDGRIWMDHSPVCSFYMPLFSQHFSLSIRNPGFADMTRHVIPADITGVVVVPPFPQQPHKVHPLVSYAVQCLIIISL